MRELSLSEQWRLLTGDREASEQLVSLVSVPGAGRGLVATREVEGGEVLLRDEALLLGPSGLSPPGACVGCQGGAGLTECDGCGWPVCARCEETHQAECPALQSLPVPTPSPALWLMILRLHLSQDPRLDLLAGLPSSASSDKYCQVTTARLGISEEESARLHAVLSANTFRNNTTRCLCPAMAMVNHSCQPNCRVYWTSPHTLVLETRRHVTAGEELTITYCCTLLATPARQAKLLASKGFQCRCERCQDPGEGQTNTGGIKCSKCGEGVILPVLRPAVDTPHISPLSWACNCGFTPNSNKVSRFIEKLEEEVNYIDMMEENNEQQRETKVQRYETFLQKKSKLLPPSSYILLQVAGNLQILLSKSKKRENLTKKRLDMMDVLDSNNRSRQKGFELFRYYDILYHKRQLLGETFQQQVSLEESLVESYILLKDDINRPNPLLYCYDKMVSALGSDHHIDCLTQKILSRYN